MGKKRCFLGFLLSLFVFVFSLNAFAEGYVCDIEYTSCTAGYYLSNGDCLACTSATNNTSTQSCTQTTCSVDHGTCTCQANAGTQTCTGNYTGGTAGSSGVSQCTGCSQWGACSGCGTKTITCDANYELDSGECKPCSRLNDTETQNITGGTRTRSVTYSSTAGGACTATYGSWTPNCTATGYHASGEECAPNTFTVTYNGNGNTGGTKPSNHTCTYGQTCTAASKGSLVKTNYDFGGWTISCNKSNNSSCTPSKSSVAGGGDITNITTENGATITLTAVWNETAANCQDGEYFNGTACVSCTTLGNEYTNSDGNRDSQSTCYTSCTKTCSGQATCPDNATCTYNTNYSTSGDQHYGGSCDAANPGVCPITDFTCDTCTKGTGAATCSVSKGTNSCTYSGTCLGGYSNATVSGSTVSCTADTYNITYNLDNGSWPSGATHPATYNVTQTINVTNPTRANYTFTGWTVTTAPTNWGSGSSSSGDTSFKIAAGTYGNIALKATWSQDAFTVTYNLNGGSGTKPSNTTCTAGVSCTLASGATTSFYRAGYVFDGWSTSASATSGTTTMTINSSTTVYAVWLPCATGSYKTSSAQASAACQTCPTGYPNTESTASTAITQCYSDTKLRPSTGEHIETIPAGCSSATFVDCTPAACEYVAYSNTTGDGDGNVRSGCSTNTTTCNKTVVAPVVAQANYFASTTATSCTACEAINPVYPKSDAGSTVVGQCYRDCKTTDVPGASAVAGRVTSANPTTDNCSATSCNSGYYLKDGACVTCPSNADCPGGTDGFTCNEGYEPNAAGDGCVGKTYNITLSPNRGSDSGTDGQTSVTATFGSPMPTLSSVATRDTFSLTGYFDAQTGGTSYYDSTGHSVRNWDKAAEQSYILYAHWSQNTVNCEAGKYYDGTTMQTCGSGYYCPGTGTAIEGGVGCRVSCTTLGSDYTGSDSGSTSSAGCYKECDNAPCVVGVSPRDCPQTPEPANSCTFQTWSTVSGIMYYNTSTCLNVTDTMCPYDNIYCPAFTYLNIDECTECPETHPLSRGNNFSNISVCYTTCELPCTKDTCPENATCDYDYSPVCYTDTTVDYCIQGKQFYGSDCNASGSCNMTITCDPGYEFDPSNATCNPGTYTITLVDPKNNTTTYIYEKYATGWYSDSAATTSITSITAPTFTNWEFDGYYTEQTGGSIIITREGRIDVSNTRFTEDTTLYAHWTQGMYTCTAGRTATEVQPGELEQCPAGYYCPGGEVAVEYKDTVDSGCVKTCPTDAGGGTVTSPTGSSTIEACQTTRTGVPLNDGTGGGDQVCNYKDADDAYTNCGKVQIKYCNEGRYRVAPDAQSCNKVGTGYWSPAPTNTTEDNISMVRYSCSVLPGYDNATTGGENAETSGLPTACYNTCSDQNVLDESNNIIGSRAANPRTVNFAGTITAYDYENATVTTSGSYPACTYDAPVCNPGYHTVGTTCEPNIYTFTLNKNGGTGGDNGPIYMKYNTGWFSDSSATTPLTSITMPTQGSQNCTGYEATIEEAQWSVINESGVITASNKLVSYNDYTTPIELMASWIQKKTETCAAGEYYDYDTRSCTTCPAGSYCEGGTAYDDEDADGDDHFITPCPTAVAGTTYTPAQEWNGTALVDIAPNVTSNTGSSEASACYATVKLTATKGAGSRICHYASGKYESNCSNEQILTCDSGFYLDTTNPSDCTAVGYQYYSATYLTTRDRCPEAVYEYGDTRNTISTDGTESELVTSCVREGVWDETAHGGRTTRCHWNTSTDTYSTNCDSYTIRKCAAGYWDALEGVTTSDDTVDCVAVGLGYYSPAPENMDPTMTTDTISTQRSQCPAGTGAVDVVSTNPTTATTTSAAITACYLTCNATKNLNGTIVNVTNSPVHYNTTKNTYDTCIYDSDTCPEDMWCDTDGFHNCPADKDGTPGKADLVPNQKYRGIETCYVLYNPFVVTENYNHVWEHGTGWVKAFYEGTEANGDYTNYYNVGALTCDAGYYYDSSIFCSGVNTCYYSPAQSAFPSENPTMTTPGSSISAIACPAGCSGSEPYAYSYEQCYKACDLTTSAFAHSKTVVPVSDYVTGASATTYNACAYEITCVTGYDVQSNGTPNPSCVAHEYTITLDKNGGAGSTPASVNCVFDSGACALPAIVDTRTGYSTANKWCTNADGSGTCYDAGTTVTTNISANASDTTLYAQWTPNIYTITLNHNGAATAGAPATVYLKYATGWYSDAGATTSITQLTTLPVKGVMTFAGYKGNDVNVIGSDGKFITSVAALTFTAGNATVVAQWSDAPITCPAGTYYAGTGEDPTDPNVCKTCEENNYCEGTTVDTNSGEAGMTVCPDGGKSPAGSDDISDCYKELLPTYEADHGHGTQTCYYDNEARSYSARCKDFAITSCDAGYWLAGESDIDCSEADVGYYSGDDELIRHQCPNGGTTMANNKTAESIYECYKTGLDYTAPDSSGSGTQSCWYSSGEGDSAVYGRECFDQSINACRGGYYRANSTDVTCTEVGQNNYSPENDIERHACPDGGKTNGITTADIGLCFKDGLEYEATHGGGSQTCNWNDDPDVQAYNIGCGDKKITWCEGGYWLADALALDCVPVGYNSYSPNRDTNRYACQPGTITLTETSDSEDDCFECPEDHVCNPDIGDKTCAELTNGQYTRSDAGTSDPAYCWAECEVSSPAAEMDGRDYNDAGNVPDTCVITKCEPGYYLEDNACVTCPAGSYCDGNDKNDCPASHPNSDTGNSSIDLCYTDCEVTPPAATMSGRDNYGVADTCEITTCEPGYYLENGTCQTCPAGSYCDGTDKHTCPSPYTQSDEGASDAKYCYKDCDNAANATAMSGRDYNNNGGGEPADTCEIVSCGVGYMFNADKTQCVRCEAGNYCDGTDGGNGDGSTSCPAGWPNSAPGATRKDQCYRECTEHDENDCHLVPEGGSEYNAYWNDKCKYTATVNGNPADYDEDTGLCTMTGCQTGYEMISGVCEPCNRENALSYETEGTCMVSACAIGYHPKADQCESDILECTPQAPNSTYAEQKWNGTLGAYETCIIKTCEEDYHLASNACVANEQVCTVANGVGVKTWNADRKDWDPCEATSCAPGYTNDPSEKNNASEQCSECRNKFSILGEVAASGYITGCEIATCMYQGEKYNLENNECVPICDRPYSDETGSVMWNDMLKKCVRTCNPGYMSW